jgi:hypothetical protein
MAFLFDRARLYPYLQCIMTLKELTDIASRLPLNAPDMRNDIDRQFATLARYNGRLSEVLGRLSRTPDDAALIGEAMVHCGASILVLAAIAATRGVDLEKSILLGKREIESD